MSCPIDIIECSLVIDEGMNTIIYDILHNEQLGYHEWMVVSNVYPEPENREFSNEDAIVEDLILLSNLGTKGNVIAADQGHEIAKYVLDGKGNVKSYECIGHRFRRVPTEVYEYKEKK